MIEAELRGLLERLQAGGWRLRGPIHREHHGDGVGGARPRRAGPATVPGVYARANAPSAAAPASW